MSNKNGGKIVDELEEHFTPVVGVMKFVPTKSVSISAFRVSRPRVTATRKVCTRKSARGFRLARPHLAKTHLLSSETAVGIFDADNPMGGPCFFGVSEPIDRTLSTSVLANDWIIMPKIRIFGVADLLHEAPLAAEADPIFVMSAVAQLSEDNNVLPAEAKVRATVTVSVAATPFATSIAGMEAETIFILSANLPDGIVEIAGVQGSVEDASIIINAEVTPQTT